MMIELISTIVQREHPKMMSFLALFSAGLNSFSFFLIFFFMMIHDEVNLGGNFAVG